LSHTRFNLEMVNARKIVILLIDMASVKRSGLERSRFADDAYACAELMVVVIWVCRRERILCDPSTPDRYFEGFEDFLPLNRIEFY
jgi:hypothetical protein